MRSPNCRCLYKIKIVTQFKVYFERFQFMRSSALHSALYVLRTSWPGLSAEGKYLLVQIVLRFGRGWVALTIEHLSRDLGMSRASVIRAREELLNVRFHGGGSFIEKKAFPGLSAADPEMLKGRPRVNIRLAEQCRLWLELVWQQLPIGSYGRYIEQLLLFDVGGYKTAGRKPGRPAGDTYALATSGRLLLAVLWAKAGDGAVMTNLDDEDLASFTGLPLSKVRYQLGRLRKMGYLKYQWGKPLDGYVPGSCPQIITLNQYHQAYPTVGQLKRSLIDVDPIRPLWGIYVHADEADEGGEDLIKEMLRAWHGRGSEDGFIALGQHDALVEVFKGHPNRYEATKYLICKACEYTLTVLCSHPDSLRPKGRLMVESVCSRIEEELFSHPELNERFGPNASRLLTIWVYAQIREQASTVCRAICTLEHWSMSEFWRSGWQRCQSVSLMPAGAGRLSLSYTVV